MFVRLYYVRELPPPVLATAATVVTFAVVLGLVVVRVPAAVTRVAVWWRRWAGGGLPSRHVTSRG